MEFFADGMHNATVWRMPPESAPLEHGVDLKEDGASTSVRGIAWHPTVGDTLISIEDSQLRQWQLDASSSQVCCMMRTPC
jgi:hypothetical protein